MTGMSDEQLEAIKRHADRIVDCINEPKHISAMEIEAFIAQDVYHLLREVKRLREREAEFEKQRADYHHVASELARCERDHDALLHENDSLRSKVAGADQRAATYSNELVMALDAGKRFAEERDELRAIESQQSQWISELMDEQTRYASKNARLTSENAAMRPIVEAVAEGGISYSEDGVGQCVFCLDYGDDDISLSHTPDCPIQQARAFVASAGQEE